MEAYIISNSCISAQDTFGGDFFFNELHSPESGRLNAIEPNYKDFIAPKVSRRMARIIKMSVATALDCLQKGGVNLPEAIITGTGLGCLKDTEKFLKDAIENKEETLSPTPFIQSTHNTIAGQIALLLKCNSYNYTYAHRGFSFESALDDALLHIREGKDNILVGGSDEFTDSSFDIIDQLNCYPPYIQGEGASFFLLSKSKKGGNPIKINYLQQLYHPSEPNDIINKAKEILKEKGMPDMILLGSDTHPEKDPWYSSVVKEFPSSSIACFKNLSGEYPTASAFGLSMAYHMLHENKTFPGSDVKGKVNGNIKNILFYNHYLGKNHALYLLSKEE